MDALRISRWGYWLALAITLPVAAENCPDHSPTNNVYWGDLHVHTRYSLDASTQDTRTSPDQAYAFARGEVLGVQPWVDGKATRELQLKRPLDFAAVTDHAELLGEVELCTREGSPAHDTLWCRLFRNFPRAAFFIFNSTASAGHRLGLCGDGAGLCLEAASDIWRDIQRAAEEANAGCEFTSFVAYEWTGASSNIGNIHRNIIFRGAEVPPSPPAFQETISDVALYERLEQDCLEAGTGCDVMVIPHNSNLSDGFMFPTAGITSAAQADQRRRMESLVEILQHKGSSECFYGPGMMEDELCAFEQLPYDKFGGKFVTWTRQPPQPDDGFVRSVLGEGLGVRRDLGSNPYEFGFIGSTDTHLGTPGAVDEKNFAGHGGAGSGSGAADNGGLVDDLEYNPGGLAAVWAPQNRRDDLFEAMRRREAYATSGPRINLRLFAGENVPEDLCSDVDMAERGYQFGRPMGAVLEPGDRMRVAVAAQRDTESEPLQRLQIIKGWVDEAGKAQEQVLDIAGDANNGASVDLATCQTRGDGFERLCQVWEDPDFSPGEQAFYYARAVENPSCRWSQHICAAQGVDCGVPGSVPEHLESCCSDTHRPVIQERAVSSPVWYYPAPDKNKE